MTVPYVFTVEEMLWHFLDVAPWPDAEEIEEAYTRLAA